MYIQNNEADDYVRDRFYRIKRHEAVERRKGEKAGR